MIEIQNTGSLFYLSQNEHEAVVVLRVHGERYPVNGVHDVGVGQRPVAAARAARLPAPL